MTLFNPPVSIDGIMAAEFYATEEATRQRAIALARNYHDGNHRSYLTDRLKEFLGADAISGNAGDPIFRLNVCRGVVQSISERLVVKGFQSTDNEFSQTVFSWWIADGLDVKSDDVHESALRDGESFVLVDWSTDEGRPVFVPHLRYISADNGGDDFGVKMRYENDDHNQPPMYAVKRWVEYLGAGKQRWRQTIYYPERIEKYARGELGTWKPFKDDGDTTWPIAWRERGGKPLGIAVIPFVNKSLRLEAWDAIPLQDAINKALIDLIATGDTTAFRIFVALGFYPTSDGKAPNADGTNLITIEPGAIIGTTKPANEASFAAIDAGDISQLISMVQNLVMWLAMATDTPLSRFQVTGQVASDDTLKQQDSPLIIKCRKRQVSFGDSWEACMRLARRLANTYGGQSLDETASIETQWESAVARNEGIELDNLKKKLDIGVPKEKLWLEAGYTADEVKAMMGMAQNESKALFVDYP